jgi:ParB family chromosome partitioning protein
MTTENVDHSETNGNGATITTEASAETESAASAIGKKVKGLRVGDPDQFTLVGIDTDDKEKHPLYDERVHLPVNKSFMLNIMELGVLEPILCRENGDHLEVIVGRQRVKAAREANRILKSKGEKPVTVPYLLKQGFDNSTVMGMMFSENTNRADDDVMLKAEKASRFMKFEPDIDRAAVYFGTNVQTIEMWLRLKGLHPDVQAAVKKGTVSATAAARLYKIPQDEQMKELEKAIEKSGSATIATIEHEVQKTRKKKAGKKVDEDALVPMTHGQIRKLLKYWEENFDGVEPKMFDFARVIVGQISPKKVSGMVKWLKAAGIVGE